MYMYVLNFQTFSYLGQTGVMTKYHQTGRLELGGLLVEFSLLLKLKLTSDDAIGCT